ncbi:hypothetical protein [Desulfosporosinus sp. OT]|uniref:hypothetical protein n=1 Tax=Desulfosporosinus sp. OT TaxID=913865 RepID=UPI0011120915|nr:hypothetical protein [Desulfosporosinus sp. OT]
MTLVLGLIPVSVLAAPPQKLSNEQVKQFEQLGFSDDEIANLSDVEINRLSEKHGKLVSKVMKYYRVANSNNHTMTEITKDQALKEVQEDNKKSNKNSDVGTMGNPNSSGNSWLSMTTSVSDLGNKDFYYKNSFKWLTDPLMHFSDVIGMTHNDSLSTISDSDYLKVMYTKYNVTTPSGNQTDYYYTATKKDVTGYAYKFPLRGTSGDYSYKYPNGYLIYECLATPSNFVGASNVYGHYDHQQIAAALSIGLTKGSQVVTPAIAIDSAPDTDASFQIE